MADRHRVALFSDAVFAVAITLLVLDLPINGASRSLLRALGDRWPAFAAFAISFVFVGCVWVSHYRIFRHVERVDPPLLFANLLLLLTIVLVPFGASTIASYATGPAPDSHLAAALFAGTLASMGAAFGVLAALVARRTGSDRRPVAWRTRLQSLVGLLVNTACIGVAFVSPPAVLVLAAVVALYYLAHDVVTPIA